MFFIVHAEFNREINYQKYRYTFKDPIAAEFKLMDMYFDGGYFGYGKDYSKAKLLAENLYSRDSEQSLYAGLRFALMYKYENENKKSIEILENLVKKEYPPAYHWLGVAYKNGDGVEKDIIKGNELINKAMTMGVIASSKY